jgi:hypothetical protein
MISEGTIPDSVITNARDLM